MIYMSTRSYKAVRALAKGVVAKEPAALAKLAALAPPRRDALRAHAAEVFASAGQIAVEFDGSLTLEELATAAKRYAIALNVLVSNLS